MREISDETGRVAQRRRTRGAIVDAATRLLKDGGVPPGVSEIAAAADVSRRTIYQYFPTIDQLLLDATLGLLSQTNVDAAIDAADLDHADAVARVEAMVEALSELSATSLPLGRSLIRLTIEAPAMEAGEPKRGYRRIGWIERALEPLRPELEADIFERLVSALAMVVGWEALVVLQDLRGLDPATQVDTANWAARALVQAARDEQAGRAAKKR